MRTSQSLLKSGLFCQLLSFLKKYEKNNSRNPFSNQVFSVNGELGLNDEVRYVGRNPFSNQVFSVRRRAADLGDSNVQSRNPFSNQVFSVK